MSAQLASMGLSTIQVRSTTSNAPSLPLWSTLQLSMAFRLEKTERPRGTYGSGRAGAGTAPS
jgi:hypothetical protein